MIRADGLAAGFERFDEMGIATVAAELIGDSPNLSSRVIGVEQRPLDLAEVLLVLSLPGIHRSMDSRRPTGRAEGRKRKVRQRI